MSPVKFLNNRNAGKHLLWVAGAFTSLGLLLACPAQAGEKPFPKAPSDSVEKMRACPEYGPGFFKPPGSGTCVKIGGRVRGETGWGSGKDRRSDATRWRSQGELGIDSRTGTAYGPARAVVRLKGQRSPDSF